MATKDIWQLIAEQIDDPKSFRNFSSVCKMFAEVSRIICSQKKTQFAKKVRNIIIEGCPCCGVDTEEGFKLPNGKWHGEYKYYDIDYECILIIIYDNGVELSRERIQTFCGDE